MIFVQVVNRGPKPGSFGWWDDLSCGHAVAYDGKDTKARRCAECERVEADTQGTLFDA